MSTEPDIVQKAAMIALAIAIYCGAALAILLTVLLGWSVVEVALT